MPEELLLHIIYTEDAMMISRKEYRCWRDIQDEYERYKASLGPWSYDDVLDYLKTDYQKSLPDAAEQLQSFLNSGEQTIALRFS